MTSIERREREAAGYEWTDEREQRRLERLMMAWNVISVESQFPLASAIAGRYCKKLNRMR